MLRLLLGFALWIVCSANALALSFDRYHSQDEINGYLFAMSHERPDLVHFRHLGYSERGREINYVIVSKNDPDTVPALYMNGAHHGNEMSSSESVLALLDYLINNKSDPTVSSLLESYAIYIQPVVNPDGLAAGTRVNADGRDPNRDYSYPERDEAESFKIPSIRLVKELSEKVRFRAAAAFHSGMEAVFWPWCYTKQRNPDQALFLQLSRTAAEAMGFKRYGQSYSDYQTAGEFVDYEYMTFGTLALTFEVSTDPAPPPAQLPKVVARSVAGAMAFMLAIKELDQGQLIVAR